jgi:phage tail-like protein
MMDGPFASSLHFIVQVDGQDLGGFSTCEGLALEVEMKQVVEGGNQEFVHQLPVRLKYTNIKLKRAVDANTAVLAKWISDVAKEVVRTTASISAMMPDESGPIVTWDFVGVLPVRWTGPSFSVDSPAVATETFEFAHHGFTVR